MKYIERLEAPLSVVIENGSIEPKSTNRYKERERDKQLSGLMPKLRNH